MKHLLDIFNSRKRRCGGVLVSDHEQPPSSSRSARPVWLCLPCDFRRPVYDCSHASRVRISSKARQAIIKLSYDTQTQMRRSPRRARRCFDPEGPQGRLQYFHQNKFHATWHLGCTCTILTLSYLNAYQTFVFQQALDEKIEKISPSLGRPAIYSQRMRLERLPTYLTVHMVRFAWRRDINKKAKIMVREMSLHYVILG